MYGRADRAVITLGNNDIHAGKPLEKIQAEYLQLIELARNRVAENVAVCTVTPRANWQGTAKETVRSALNDWLLARPWDISSCIDLAASVESVSGDAPEPETSAADGIHFNSLGSLRLARAYAADGDGS